MRYAYVRITADDLRALWWRLERTPKVNPRLIKVINGRIKKSNHYDVVKIDVLQQQFLEQVMSRQFDGFNISKVTISRELERTLRLAQARKNRSGRKQTKFLIGIEP